MERAREESRVFPAAEPARVRPFVSLLPYQQADIESDARFRWSCWARQTGKSFTKSLRRVLRGLARRRTQVFLSAGERQSRELMLKARQHCQVLKIATEFFDAGCFAGMAAKRLEIVLPGGVRIIGLPANPQTARGFTGDVLLDEFAMHEDDRDIWGAMFPTLLRGDGELDVASTPRGCGNVFYDLRSNERFERTTLTLPEAIAQGLAADEGEIRAALGDELLYRQEFLCEFLDEAHAFLSWRDIAACGRAGLRLCSSVEELADLRGELFVGVDIGRHRDLTVIWVVGDISTLRHFDISTTELRSDSGAEKRDTEGTEAHRVHRKVEASGAANRALKSGGTAEGAEKRVTVGTEPHRVHREVEESGTANRGLKSGGTAEGAEGGRGGRGEESSHSGPQLQTVAIFELAAAPFREQQALLHAVLGLRQVRQCCIDAGGLGMQLAEQAVEHFGGHRVEAVVLTPALRSQIAGGLRIAVEGRRIAIPDDERIFRDWHSIERTVSEAGHFRLAAPRREGSHADRFWAAALAVYAASVPQAAAEVQTVRPLQFAREGVW